MLDEAGQLLHSLEHVSLDVNRERTQFWSAGIDGKFAVKSCYTLLRKQNGNWDLIWTWKTLWKTRAPTKVACFGWIAVREPAYLKICYKREASVFAADVSYVKTLQNL